MKCPTTSTALAANRPSKLSDTLLQVWHPLESKYEGKHKIFGRNVVLITPYLTAAIPTTSAYWFSGPDLNFEYNPQ